MVLHLGGTPPFGQVHSSSKVSAFVIHSPLQVSGQPVLHLGGFPPFGQIHFFSPVSIIVTHSPLQSSEQSEVVGLHEGKIKFGLSQIHLCPVEVMTQIPFLDLQYLVKSRLHSLSSLHSGQFPILFLQIQNDALPVVVNITLI